MTITDEIRHKAWDVFTTCKSEFISDKLDAVLEAVAPMIAAEAFREAYLLQAYKGKTGRDAYLARAQELDPK